MPLKRETAARDTAPRLPLINQYEQNCLYLAHYFMIVRSTLILYIHQLVKTHLNLRLFVWNCHLLINVGLE